MLTHPDKQELLEFIFGALYGERGREVTSHARGCAECSRSIEQLEKVISMYKEVPLEVPSLSTLEAVRLKARRAKPRLRLDLLGRSSIFSRAFGLAMVTFVVAGLALYYRYTFYDLPQVMDGVPRDGVPRAPVSAPSQVPQEEEDQFGDRKYFKEVSPPVGMPEKVTVTEGEPPAMVSPESVSEERELETLSLPTMPPGPPVTHLPRETTPKVVSVPEQPPLTQIQREASTSKAVSVSRGASKEAPSSSTITTAVPSQALSKGTVSQETEDDPDTLFNKALTLEKEGDYAGAEETYREIWRKFPHYRNRVNVGKRRALCLKKLGRHQEADEQFKALSRSGRVEDRKPPRPHRETGPGGVRPKRIHKRR